MERDNRKAREDARREYNETVRVRKQTCISPASSLTASQSLVKYIRKRDPRYRRHLETLANVPTSKTPARVDKPKTSDLYVEQDWQKVDASRLHADLDWVVAEGGDLEEWECVVCRKTFRSDAAWNSHERSKKHSKELERLKRDMEQDDIELALDHATKDLETESIASESEHTPGDIIASELPESHKTTKIPTETTSCGRTKTTGPSRDQSQVKLDSISTSDEDVSIAIGMDDQADTTLYQPSKREKRRARQAKKVELQVRNDAGVRGFPEIFLSPSDQSRPQHHCHVCNEVFPSRTKLFNHLNEEGHALAAPEQESKPHKGMQKKR